MKYQCALVAFRLQRSVFFLKMFKKKAAKVKPTINMPIFAARFKNTLVNIANRNIMAGNRTFTMIKPDAVKNNNIGNILAHFVKGGFRIVAMKYTQLSAEKAGEFYAVHKERPFYGELVAFMSSGPIVAAILEKDNAVEDFRTLIGATDPAKASQGTVRQLYGTNVGENAVHGSDSDENAAIESAFFFSVMECF